MSALDGLPLDEYYRRPTPAGDQPFYGGAAPHVADSATSAAAAKSIDPTSMAAQVLEFIRGRVDGATDDEVERNLEMRHQTASARRRELVIKGLLVDSGRTRNTSSGRKATVWVPVGVR
jgi:hypothetical protein